MVMSFRVSELQVLLGFAGRNKSGRKHELLAKALHLLKSSCAPSKICVVSESGESQPTFLPLPRAALPAADPALSASSALLVGA